MDMVDILGFFFTLSMMQIGQVSPPFLGFLHVHGFLAIYDRDAFPNANNHGRRSAGLWSRLFSTGTSNQNGFVTLTQKHA